MLKRIGFFRLLVLIICITMFTTGSFAADKEEIRIVSGSLGGSWYPFGAVVGENVLKPGGFDYTNTPGGGSSNVVAVSKGQGDMGITMTTSIIMARNGEGPYNGNKYSNLVVVASLFNDPLHILVPIKSDIKRCEASKRISE